MWRFICQIVCLIHSFFSEFSYDRFFDFWSLIMILFSVTIHFSYEYESLCFIHPLESFCLAFHYMWLQYLFSYWIHRIHSFFSDPSSLLNVKLIFCYSMLNMLSFRMCTDSFFESSSATSDSIILLFFQIRLSFLIFLIFLILNPLKYSHSTIILWTIIFWFWSVYSFLVWINSMNPESFFFLNSNCCSVRNFCNRIFFLRMTYTASSAIRATVLFSYLISHPFTFILSVSVVSLFHMSSSTLILLRRTCVFVFHHQVG